MIKNLQHTPTAVADAKQCREPVGKRHNTSTVSDFYNIHSRILWICTQGNHKGLHVAVQYFTSGLVLKETLSFLPFSLEIMHDCHKVYILKCTNINCCSICQNFSSAGDLN